MHSLIPYLNSLSYYTPVSTGVTALKIVSFVLSLLLAGLVVAVIVLTVRKKKTGKPTSLPDIPVPDLQTGDISEKFADLFKTETEKKTQIVDGTKPILRQLNAQYEPVGEIDLGKLFASDNPQYIFRPDNRKEAPDGSIILHRSEDVNTVSSFTYVVYSDENGSIHLCIDNNVSITRKGQDLICSRTLPDGTTKRVNPIFVLKDGKWNAAETLCLEDGTVFALGRQIFDYHIKKNTLPVMNGSPEFPNNNPFSGKASANDAETSVIGAPQTKPFRPHIRKE